DLREQAGDEVLESAGVLDAAGRNRLVAGVADQLLGDVARLVLRRVETAGSRPLVCDLVVERREVCVERLRNGTVRVRLHFVRERFVLLVASRERILRV